MPKDHWKSASIAMRRRIRAGVRDVRPRPKKRRRQAPQERYLIPAGTPCHVRPRGQWA
jgi:hypothetical protein